MNAAVQRILSAFALLVIFTLALYLRLYGIDWALRDGVHSPHPDERHYENCANRVCPQGLTPEERQLPLREQAQLLYERNLKIDTSIPIHQDGVCQGLRPVNYNYGTLPLHLYLLYRSYVAFHGNEPGDWVFLSFDDWLSLAALLIVLFIGIQLYRAIRRDFRQTDRRHIPWYQDSRPLTFFFPALIMPIIGLLLMVALPASINDFTRYHPDHASILLIGRIITAWSGALSVLLAYLIGRDAYNRTAGLIAALILATAMLHVQTSHFATVDVLVGFWATAAIYCFLRISKKPRLIWYILGAIAVGFGVATKWSGVTVPGVLLVAHAAATWGDDRHGKTGRWINTIWLLIAGLVLLHFFKAASSTDPWLHISMAQFRDFYWNWKWWILALFVSIFIASLAMLIVRNRWNNGETGWFKPLVRIYTPWLWLLISIPVGVIAFYVGAPMAYFDAIEFARSLAEQNAIIVRGTGAVYTIQFLHTPGLFYFIDNLFYPSLDSLTAFFVVGGTLYALVRTFIRPKAAELVLVAWVVPSFILYGTFHAKFPRYLDTILPVMAVFGGRLIADLIFIKPRVYHPAWPNAGIGLKRFGKGFGLAGGSLALLCGLIYGYAYIGVYDQPHTMVQASNLIRSFAAEGSTFLQMAWDEGLPGVHASTLDVHNGAAQDQNPEQRAQYFANQLSRTDYLIFPSKRAYGSTFQAPELFPVTNPFLKALFAEQLGFKVAKVVTNPPKFLWWEFRVDEEDETARIYDHPKVIIFEKFQDFEPEQLKEIILNPPSWVNEITKKDILRLRDSYPVWYQPPSIPVIRWWLIMQALGALAFLLLFPLCTRLPDRGFGVSKPVGLALFAWVCWLLASVNVMPFSRWQAFFIFLGLTAAAVFIASNYAKDLWAFLRERWLMLLGYEAVFLGLWLIFLIIRAYHPDAIWGEKPMNVSFLNAVFRTDTFPPEDPWIANYGINYYYYGHAILAIAGKLIGLPPSHLFNIGGTSITAMVGLGVFSLVYSLSSRVWVSALATYLCVFAGHIISLIRMIQFEINNNQITFTGFFSGCFQLIGLMFNSMLIYLGISEADRTSRFFHGAWDRIFWTSSHNVPDLVIIPGTAATEFPYWMHLFLDVHAHMLVIPFVIAYITLLYAWFARPRRETPGPEFTGLVFFLALLLGTITCVNTWDLPACMLGLLFIAGVKFWRESPMFTGTTRPTWLHGDTMRELAQFPLAPVVLVLVLSYTFFYPFHFHFISRVSEVKMMTEGNTKLLIYLGLWGHILIPVIVASLLFFIVRRNGAISIPRTLLASGLFILILLFALYVTRANPFGFPPPGFDGPRPGNPLDYRVVGLFLPFLLMLFFVMWQRWRDERFVFACLIGVLGLGLSVGIELFYVKEPNWGPPSHRWNTVFKFNIQVWHYLSMFAALGLFYVWRMLGEIGLHIGGWFAPLSRFAFTALAALLLLATVPFAVVAPRIVTLTGGAISRDIREPHLRDTIPTVDGYDWLHDLHYETYAAIQWLNRFVPGTSNIVEMVGNEYNIFSPYSTNTGLPALLGWGHHVSERIHYNHERDIRREAANRVYTSQEREAVARILGRYQIEYLIFGKHELERLGQTTLERLEQWGDLLRLVYRYGDVSIFKVDSSLNKAYGIESQREVVQKLPPALRPPEPNVSMFTGTNAVGEAIFAEPRGIEAGADGKIYIADTFKHQVQVFNPDGSLAWRTGRKGSGVGEFIEPNDITIDLTTRNLYIADTWNHRIVMLNPMGEPEASSEVNFFGPRGIVYHPSLRMLYITDTGRDQVVVMTPDLQEIDRWGTLEGGEEDMDFREPVGITILPEGNVLVADTLNRRLKVHKPDDGTLMRMWPIQTTAEPGMNFEAHVACSTDGRIYMTDTYERSVHVYSLNGELLEKIRSDVSGQPINTPVGITISPQGQIFVTDRAMNRVHRVR